MPKGDSNSSVETVVQFLLQQGVLNEDGCSRFANVIRGLQAISGGAPAVRRGRPAGAGRKGKRGRITATADELKKMYLQDGMTAKQIAAKYNVSAGAVAVRLSKEGLTKRAGGAKKSGGKKKAPRKAGTKAKKAAPKKTASAGKGEAKAG